MADLKIFDCDKNHEFTKTFLTSSLQETFYHFLGKNETIPTLYAQKLA